MEAPDLPANTLTYECYMFMFNGCSSLKYIKCLAENISANRCTHSWVGGVTEVNTSTFVKSPNISENTWGRSYNGIPGNWTVIDNA